MIIVATLIALAAEAAPIDSQPPAADAQCDKAWNGWKKGPFLALVGPVGEDLDSAAICAHEYNAAYLKANGDGAAQQPVSPQQRERLCSMVNAAKESLLRAQAGIDTIQDALFDKRSGRSQALIEATKTLMIADKDEWKACARRMTKRLSRMSSDFKQLSQKIKINAESGLQTMGELARWGSLQYRLPAFSWYALNTLPPGSPHDTSARDFRYTEPAAGGSCKSLAHELCTAPR